MSPQPSDSTTSKPQGDATEADSKKPFPANEHLLTDIHAVPSLSEVTPAMALSYLNQMLDNLMLFHHNHVASAGFLGSPGHNSVSPAWSATDTPPSLESRVVSESSPSSTSPNSSPSTDNAKADQKLPHDKTGSAISNVVIGSPVTNFSEVDYILEEAAAVAAAVINRTESFDLDPNQTSPHNNSNSIQPSMPSSFGSLQIEESNEVDPTLKTRNRVRKAVTKNELSNKVIVIKRFLQKKQPDISIWDYLQRVHQYCPMSTSVYLSASLYIYRLCISLQTFVLSPLSVHRLLLATLRAACKNIEDITFTQKRFATVGGVSTADLYRLEIAFLFLIDFDVCIDSEVLQHHLVVLTELQIQAERFRQSLRKRPRSSDVE